MTLQKDSSAVEIRSKGLAGSMEIQGKDPSAYSSGQGIGLSAWPLWPSCMFFFRRNSQDRRSCALDSLDGVPVCTNTWYSRDAVEALSM